jgi:hypothetical protein
MVASCLNPIVAVLFELIVAAVMYFLDLGFILAVVFVRKEAVGTLAHPVQC